MANGPSDPIRRGLDDSQITHGDKKAVAIGDGGQSIRSGRRISPMPVVQRFGLSIEDTSVCTEQDQNGSENGKDKSKGNSHARVSD